MEGVGTKVKEFLIKFEIFRSNLISVGNVFWTNFKILSGSGIVWIGAYPLIYHCILGYSAIRGSISGHKY